VTQTTIWILYLAVFVGIFYFFIFRPQMNRQKEQMALMSSLAEGDRIVTAGGIFGTIRNVEEDAVEVEIAPDVIVRLAKGAVARKLEA
jgi:preprotein translocase subunit YajC